MMRQRKGPEQPGPNCSLVIGGVAFARPAAVMPLVAGLTGCEAAKPIWRQQLGRADVNDGLLLLPRQRSDRQRHRKDLVRPQRSVIADSRRVDHVVTALSLCIPKFVEALLGLAGQTLIVVA